MAARFALFDGLVDDGKRFVAKNESSATAIGSALLGIPPVTAPHPAHSVHGSDADRTRASL